MNIIKEENINIYNQKYKEITYDDGHSELKHYLKQYNMWVTLQFSDEEDIEKIKKITLNCLRW